MSVSGVAGLALRRGRWAAAALPLKVYTPPPAIAPKVPPAGVPGLPGGTAAYAKIAAARHLGLPVIMIERPLEPARASVRTAKAAMDWLGSLLGHDHVGVASERGV